MAHRPYRDEHDLMLLLDWLSEHADMTYMHPGDLVWWLRKNALVDPTKALELFFDGSGALQSFSFLDAGAWAVLQGTPMLPEQVWDEMIASLISGAEAGLVVQPHEFDVPQIEALGRAGFTSTRNRMLRLERLTGPHDLDAVDLPPGHRFADMQSGEVSAEARVELHQHVWKAARHTLDVYRRMQVAPLYRPDLDVMVVAPSGELACYAVGWYDDASRTGLMEPVGTHEAFRQRGLGKRLIREMTRRLAALGARKVTIGSYEKNQASTNLYQSAGYSLNGHWLDFKREPTQVAGEMGAGQS